MSENIFEDIGTFIEQHTTFFIMSHEEPDGDCIGSSLALESLLERMGKQVFLYSPGPFKRFEIQQYADLFRTAIADEYTADAAIFVLDCSTPDRIGTLYSRIREHEIAVIDHHSAGEPFGSIRYIDTRAPSVTFMIQKLFAFLDLSLTKEEAHYLLFGVCTDTGFFRHVTGGSADVFRSVAELSEAGASPNHIYREMYGNRPLESRLLLGRLLARTESHYNGKLLITFENKVDLGGHDISIRDSDTLYMLLQSVRGVQVVILIREEEEGQCSVGLRSNEAIDVGEIARSFGGGGHKKAAGFYWQGPIPSIKPTLIDTLAAYL
jgi:phosphoesterase RecJ-like protein